MSTTTSDVIASHLHIGDLDLIAYAWLDADAGPLQRTYDSRRYALQSKES